MERGDLEARIGPEEAARYFAILERSRAGGGSALDSDADLLDPDSIVELGGNFRPGLLAFAEESAGDFLVWDLRRPSQAPSVLRCDHELGILEYVGATIDDAVRARPDERKPVGLCTLPPTHVPLLLPDDPKCLDEALPRYEEATAFYRELVDDEGRSEFRAHLADTLRWHAGVLLRREKWNTAERAAREAVTLDERDAHQAFCQRVLATTAARAKKFEEAFAHADAALAAAERVMVAQTAVIRAATSAVDGWVLERTGGAKDEVKLRIKNAQKWSAPHRAQFPIAETLANFPSKARK